MGEDVFGIVGTTQAAHFKVEEAVAEGGFAVVYRAHHDAFRAPVALKCLKVPATLTPPQRENFRERFREEAELLFRLSALIPAIVRPLQVGTLDIANRYVPFLALEWLEGETLENMRDRRADSGEPPIALRKLVKLLTPVAQALAQAHRLPGPDGPVAVVHCDLKPDNLYLATAGTAQTMKILDFGIARVKGATKGTAGKATGNTGANAFTPQYAASEQWQPEVWGQTGPWTDVWGLAISMVDMLLGKPPIDGSLAQMMFAALDPKKRPTPRNVGISVSDAVEEVFRSALDIDPKKRTESIEEFWSGLERALAIKLTFAVVDPRSESPDSVAPPPVDVVAPAIPRASRAPKLDREAQQAQTLDARSLPPGAPGRPSRKPTPEPMAAFDAIPDLVPDLVPSSPPKSAGGSKPAPRADAVPDLVPTAASKPPVSAPVSKPASVVQVVDPVDQAAEEAQMSLQLASPIQVSRPAPSRRSMAEPHVPLSALRRPEPPASVSTLMDKLATPFKLLLLAMVIMVADQVYVRLTGTQFTIGPARALWIAGPIVGIAVLMGFLRMVSDT